MASHQRLLQLAGIVLLLVVAAIVYGRGLERAPIHVHYDEVLFGLEARSIAETGRDTNGRRLPLYFQVGPNLWYQPIPIYFGALFATALPLSDTAIRLPTVVIGLINVGLMYLVARRVFRRESLALLAAVFLAATPAHFIHSRIAMDYLYPIPFVLTWMLCLLAYDERRQNWLLFAAASSLGLGFYSYIASVVMMPIYLGITWLFLYLAGAPWRAYATSLCGFAWPLLMLPVFLLAHPEIIGDFESRYRLAGGASQLDPLQTLRAAFNSRNIAERANLYYNFFSPGFLFVTGGSNVTNSTREAGVFLASVALFLLAGLYDAVTRPTREKYFVLLGFLTAPVAACIVLENYAIDRALGLLPFGVLLAIFGLARMWSAPTAVRTMRFGGAAGGAILLLGGGYMAWTLGTRGSISNTAPWLVVAGAMITLTAYAVQRTRRWAPVVMLLLLVSAAQFQYFYRDYFGDYGPRSAGWYGNNIEGAIERVIALDAEHPAPKVLFVEDIRQIKAYWRFYLRVHGREDLIPKGETFRFDQIDVAALPSGTLIVTAADDPRIGQLVENGNVSLAGVATDPNDRYSPLGPGTHVSYTIYRTSMLAGD